MREQSTFDLFLPLVQPPTQATRRASSAARHEDAPLLLDSPEMSDPSAERALWEKRAVLIRSWHRSYGWDMLDCAFELGVTRKALEAGLRRHGLEIPASTGEPTTDRPCSSCGRLVRATRFQRLCLSTAKAGADCGGSAELVDDIERRERKRKHAGGDAP